MGFESSPNPTERPYRQFLVEWQGREWVSLLRPLASVASYAITGVLRALSRSRLPRLFLSPRLRPCPIFFEAQLRREKLQAFQVFDIAAYCSLVHAELAGNRGIGRLAVIGLLVEVA